MCWCSWIKCEKDVDDVDDGETKNNATVVDEDKIIMQIDSSVSLTHTVS